MEIVLYILILIVAFYLMAKIVDDYFISSLDSISRRTNMSSDAAGATLMAMGSSAPELFIAIFSLIKAFIDPGQEHETIGIGTIVGSALFNVLVIVGASGIAKRSFLIWQDIARDLLFYSLSIGLLIWTFYDFNITLVESLALIAFYGIYVIIVLNWDKICTRKPVFSEPEYTQSEKNDNSEYSGWRIIQKPLDKAIDAIFPKKDSYIGVFVVSIILIGVLSWALVESAVVLSHILSVPKAIIGLTVLAIGTSVPDLMSSVIVAKQGRGGMAVSNSIGSNIFDILIGLGLPWAITIIFTGNIDTSTQNLFISSIILFGSVLLITMVLMIQKWKVDFRSGLFFVLLYIGYLGWEIIHIL